MNIGIETPIDLSELLDAVQDITRRRRKLNKAIDWRWARKGVQGVRLEYVRVGRVVDGVVWAGFQGTWGSDGKQEDSH